MANKLLKCVGCKQRFAAETMIKLPIGNVHSIQCATAYAITKQEAARSRQKRKTANDNKLIEKAARVKHREAKERIKKLSEWYDNLQTVVNQWVVHVRDKNEPCCTCGKTTQGIKYDAGHMRSRGACPELRFELTNIHKQCSVNCNKFGSGMRKEYELFIIEKYGSEHLEWLNGPHKTLKETFPHYTDIKTEIQRYRVMLRSEGITPNY